MTQKDKLRTIYSLQTKIEEISANLLGTYDEMARYIDKMDELLKTLKRDSEDLASLQERIEILASNS